MTIVSPQFGGAVNVWACLVGLGSGAVLTKVLPRRDSASAEPVVPASYLAAAAPPMGRDVAG